jgi:hypothetical protein
MPIRLLIGPIEPSSVVQCQRLPAIANDDIVTGMSRPITGRLHHQAAFSQSLRLSLRSS